MGLKMRIKQLPRRRKQNVTDLAHRAERTNPRHLEDLQDVELGTIIKIIKKRNTLPNNARKPSQKIRVNTKR